MQGGRARLRADDWSMLFPRPHRSFSLFYALFISLQCCKGLCSVEVTVVGCHLHLRSTARVPNRYGHVVFALPLVISCTVRSQIQRGVHDVLNLLPAFRGHVFSDDADVFISPIVVQSRGIQINRFDHSNDMTFFTVKNHCLLFSTISWHGGVMDLNTRQRETTRESATLILIRFRGTMNRYHPASTRFKIFPIKVPIFFYHYSPLLFRRGTRRFRHLQKQNASLVIWYSKVLFICSLLHHPPAKCLLWFTWFTIISPQEKA